MASIKAAAFGVVLLAIPGCFAATSSSATAQASKSQPTLSGAATSTTSLSFTLSIIPTSVATQTTPTSASFPPVSGVSQDYSPSGLAKLWDLVGPVASPPFTTTPVPTSTPLPPAPPPLYPSWFSPAPKDMLPDLKYPDKFIFGVATAAYQVEGAAKADGKGPTTWDWAGRQPLAIADNTTGDIVDLHYYLYKEDVARVAALGVNAHSFSISWARIFPFGTKDSPVNQAGLDHYSDVIDYHLQAGVQPVITLFHWDTPLALMAYYGGFTSPRIVEDYVNYATTVFKAFNGRIKTWYTFNEPRVFCSQLGTYPFNSTFAPGVNSSTAPYQCSYYLLKAHAGAVKAFRALNISGEIAFKSDDFVGKPWRSNSTVDSEAVERHAAFRIGLFADPVYTTGDWPQLIKDTLPPEYLPRLTAEDKKDILGSADFFAIDAYRSQWLTEPDTGLDACKAAHSTDEDPNWPECSTAVLYDTNNWAAGPSADPRSTWDQPTPQMLRYALGQLHKRWPAPKMYISEFGIDEPFETELTDLWRITEDPTRTNYFMTNLGEALLAIHEDKIPLAGVFAWAMVDNAEWQSGLAAKFGIQYVNYTTLERTYKRSAFDLAEFFKAHLQGNTTYALE
ncbi:glycoside hydrolase family 1 protein [Plicaturopsis crispa FD-325 SS-3]|nr:glycoside hydrolase family 1 protein [Plicaturopsis crispa FD-325 SS-3]